MTSSKNQPRTRFNVKDPLLSLGSPSKSTLQQEPLAQPKSTPRAKSMASKRQSASDKDDKTTGHIPKKPRYSKPVTPNVPFPPFTPSSPAAKSSQDNFVPPSSGTTSNDNISMPQLLIDQVPYNCPTTNDLIPPPAINVPTISPITSLPETSSSPAAPLTKGYSSPLIEQIPLTAENLEGIDVAFKVLSDLVNDAKKTSADPVKSNVCEVLSKHLGSDTVSQASLVQEINKLKDDLQVMTAKCNSFHLENQKFHNLSLDRDNLRKKNEELKESERKLRSTISTLRSDYSKIRKENGLLSSHLARSRDRAERRFDYMSYCKDIDSKNHQKALLRQFSLKAEVLVNDILLSNSLAPIHVDPLEVSDDEVPDSPDSDYDYESGEDVANTEVIDKDLTEKFSDENPPTGKNKDAENISEERPLTGEGEAEKVIGEDDKIDVEN